MEISESKLKQIFKEIITSTNSESKDFITLREFKQIVKTYDIELIKGQELSDNDFHECWRQMFSQICHKSGKNTNFKNTSKHTSHVHTSNLKTSDSFGKTLKVTETK